ncbi:hypothetical protein LEN26_001676 [Aphanomyces euteiches]|nr:hypothetical protein AeMF1_018630 [Aphanomyces euteiches]KAH9160894.1 hypothetical protein LEN26_001676 [Aphanomyces euteiches]KAH9194424.1 hypothetical protein AeNC1_003605 [Aphanomyces euteiches]
MAVTRECTVECVCNLIKFQFALSGEPTGKTMSDLVVFSNITFASLPYETFSLEINPVSNTTSFPPLHLVSSQTGRSWNGHLDGLQDSNLTKTHDSNRVIEVLQEWLNLSNDNKDCNSKSYQVDLMNGSTELMHLLIAVKDETTDLAQGYVWQLEPRHDQSLSKMMATLSRYVISRHGPPVLIYLRSSSLHLGEYAVWKTLVDTQYFELVDGNTAIKVVVEGQYQVTVVPLRNANPKQTFELVGSRTCHVNHMTLREREASKLITILSRSKLQLFARNMPEKGSYTLVIQKFERVL